jgi:hypothetical protein
MKKTALQLALTKVAPSICIRTLWEHDPDMHDITKDCDMPPETDPDDWQAWQSEVRATAIVDGEEVSGSDYLGGTWEKAGDDPAESNPDISGYEPDMTEKALRELHGLIEEVNPESPLLAEIDAALTAIEAAAE